MSVNVSTKPSRCCSAKGSFRLRLVRIDTALEDCESHLASSESFGTPIDSLLTYSLLVVIYAEFEQQINSIVRQRCDSIEDDSLREIVLSCIGNVSRIKSSDIGDLLKRFGANRRAAFRYEIGASIGNQQAETSYNNLITNRNDTAHGIGSNLTFADVKRFYEEGHVVLDFFKDILLSADGG